MNLIEQFGSYENAKSILDNCPEFYHEYQHKDIDIYEKGYYRDSRFGRVSMVSLKNSLLQYRRENNIFEVGDLITHPKYDWLILKVHDPIPDENLLFAFTNNHVKYHWGHGLVFDKKGVVGVTYRDCRHVIDEEIKAGRRL